MKNTVVVTTADLKAMGACDPGLEWWEQHFPEGKADSDVVINALLKDGREDYADWLIEAYDLNEFEFDDLSESAKQTAIDYLTGDIDYSFLYENFVLAGEMIGVEFATRRGTRSEPCIWWSGFYHQGSGLGFDGTYRYAKGAPKAVAAEWPLDDELKRIAVALQEAQRPNFYRLYATIGSVQDTGIRVNVEDGENPYRDIGDAEKEVEDALQDFCSWMYWQIQEEYEYETSEECVSELCAANGYKFNSLGQLL